MNKRHLLNLSIESREYYDYVVRLNGGNLSTKALLEYAEKLIRVADIAEEWQTAKDSVEKLNKSGKEVMTVYLFKDYGNFRGIVSRLRDAITEHFIVRIREIFNDSEGKYLLEWNDFCHTGRTSLILVPVALRNCARALISLAKDQKKWDLTPFLEGEQL